MQCPVCKISLIVVERNSIELDYCIVCKGLWFDAEELGLLSEALEIQVDLPDIAALAAVESKEKPRKCPRCGKKMDKIRLGNNANILIDRCVQGHGMWFDWGELGRVIQHHATGHSGEGEAVFAFLGETFRLS